METKIKQDEMIEKVQEALQTIRPFLNRDGGDIELLGIENNRVFVKLHGNCNGCPMSLSTIKLGVENTIKQYVPIITEVINME
jgi:Fe-S cluster biogenesis protein NfuA